jgi:hypothetical protein
MKKKRVLHSFGSIVIMACVLWSCAPRIPKEALQLSPQGLRNRQLQTRSFDTDETTLLSASAAVLQDLGFTIDESETELGTIICSKRCNAMRWDADTISQILALAVVGIPAPIDKEQLVRASLVTNPIHVEDTDKTMFRTAVRITFQRTVFSIYGTAKRRESVNDPELYREFFEKLSKSLFLEAHGI